MNDVEYSGPHRSPTPVWSCVVRHRPHRLTALGAAGTALALLWLVVGPAGAQYDGTPSLACQPVRVTPGAAVTCEARGFRGGTTVQFTLGGAVATAEVDRATGIARSSLTVAEGSAPGVVQAVAAGSSASSGEPLRLTADVTIEAPGTTTPSDTAAPDGTTPGTTPVEGTTGTTPATTTETDNGGGGGVSPLVFVVAALVVAGVVAAIVLRRRSTADDGDDATGTGDTGEPRPGPGTPPPPA